MEKEGDRAYIAPEIITSSLLSPPADIFSLGLVLLEMAANIVLPQNGDNWHALRRGGFIRLIEDVYSGVGGSIGIRVQGHRDNESDLMVVDDDQVHRTSSSSCSHLPTNTSPAEDLDTVMQIGGLAGENNMNDDDDEEEEATDSSMASIAKSVLQLSPRLRQLLDRMLDRLPEQRPRAEVVISELI